jgi:hypothetical protein
VKLPYSTSYWTHSAQGSDNNRQRDVTYRLLDDLSNVERSLDEMSARHGNLCLAVMEEIQALEAHPANDCLLHNRPHLTIDADLKSLEKEMSASCSHRRNILKRLAEENQKRQPSEASSRDLFLVCYQHAASCDDTFSYIVDMRGRTNFSYEQVVGGRYRTVATTACPNSRLCDRCAF